MLRGLKGACGQLLTAAEVFNYFLTIYIWTDKPEQCNERVIKAILKDNSLLSP